MQKTKFRLLNIMILLLTSCAQNVSAQVNEVTPTSVIEKAEPTVTLEVVPHDPPASCPVTILQDPPFNAPSPYSANAPWPNQFWYGSKSLWVALPTDGIWFSLPHNPQGYTQKIPWWSNGYVWDAEPEPALIVTGERVDAQAPALNASTANGSYAADMGSAMMMGVDFPTLGCWKITGKYQDAELSFVVWVAP